MPQRQPGYPARVLDDETHDELVVALHAIANGDDPDEMVEQLRSIRQLPED